MPLSCRETESAGGLTAVFKGDLMSQLGRVRLVRRKKK